MKRSGDSFCLQLSSTHRKMSPCLPTEKESILYEIDSVWQDVLMFQVCIYIQLYTVSIDINMGWSGLQWSVMLHLAPTCFPLVFRKCSSKFSEHQWGANVALERSSIATPIKCVNTCIAAQLSFVRVWAIESENLLQWKVSLRPDCCKT